jgi:hypothetical protein
VNPFKTNAATLIMKYGYRVVLDEIHAETTEEGSSDIVRRLTSGTPVFVLHIETWAAAINSVSVWQE